MELGRYEFVGGNSAKYWHIVFDKTKRVYLAKWGKIGKSPQGSKEYSREQAFKKIREKVNKGYGLVPGFEESVGENSVHFILEECA